MKYFPALAGLLALVALPVLAAEAERPEAPKEPVPIVGSKRTVMFPHDKGHETIECVVCHHKVDDKETFAKCADAGCHDDLKARKGEHSLYFVIHNKGADLKHQTCMSCHVKIVEEKPDLKKILTGCSGSGCHPAVKKTAAETPANEKSMNDKPADAKPATDAKPADSKQMPDSPAMEKPAAENPMPANTPEAKSAQ